jgi:serine protease AprX
MGGVNTLRHFVIIAAVAVAGIAGSPGTADAQHAHATLDRALAQAAVSAPDVQPVIVRVTPGARLAVKDQLTAAGYHVTGEHASIDGLVVQLPSTALTELAANPDIVSMSTDAIVTPTGVYQAGSAWPRPDRANNVLRSTLGLDGHSPRGAGVGIALIDSGVEPDIDLAGRIVAFFDATGGAVRRAPASDDYGHGTHVAGLIAGSGLRSAGVYEGVAPGARLTVFKVLDATGQGRTSDVVRAIEYIVRNRQRLGIDVINLSLGHPIFEPAASDPLVQAIEQATRSGLVVVAAAGNCGINPITGEPGYAGVTSPGNAPSAITVGALLTQGTPTRSDDEVAAFSSRGPTWYDAFAKPDIVAPGDRLVSLGAPGSTLYEEYPSLHVSGRFGGHYLRLSGTSMATAVATGVVALAIEANRDREHGVQTPLTANALKAILQFSALPLHDASGNDYDPLTEGGGGINAAGAIELAQAVDTDAPIGSQWVAPEPQPVTTIDGEDQPWAQRIVWGVWEVPGSVFYTNAECWRNNIVWGVSDRKNIVWGVSDPLASGTNIMWARTSFGV